MYSRILLLPLVASLVSSSPTNLRRTSDFPIIKKDDGNGGMNQTCMSYGIDFADGGSYFLNSNSDANFTCVSQFVNCQNDDAYVILVNDQTSDQYYCTSIPTGEDNVSQVSTCPIQQDQLTSGNYSLLIIGNNGEDGDPYAYQRDFYITVGPQQTVTVTPTATYFSTVMSVVTATNTSTVSATTSVSATYTITKPASTCIITSTPRAVTTTKTNYVTRTMRRWTKTQIVVTSTVSATCTVPPRPYYPDPPCRIMPTMIALPEGVQIQSKRSTAQTPEVEQQKRDLARRAVDQPTVTITAPTAVNTTVTVTAPPSTFYTLTLVTTTQTTTLPPRTVKAGTRHTTVTAPTPTVTRHAVAYTVVYTTKTMTAKWTYTTTVAPSASVTACRERGGHYGRGFNGDAW